MANSQSVTDDTNPALIAIDLTDVNEVLEAFYAWLSDPAKRVETITKAQIEAMSEVQRRSHTYTKTQVVGPEFFRLEFVPPPLE